MRQRLVSWRVVVVLGLGLGLAACEAGDVSEGRIGRTSSAWTGGVDDTANQPVGNAVVELRRGGVQCSGTLISPLVVLTAAHCIDGGPGIPGFGSTPPVSAAPPREGLTPASDLVSTRSVTRLRRKLENGESAEDVALVILDEAALQANYQTTALTFSGGAVPVEFV